ncbi:MAG: Rieske (2Fe-2S) protein [Anaerolineae bacterium]
MTDAKDETQTSPLPGPSAFASRRRFIQLGLVAMGAAWAGTFIQSRLFPQAAAQEAKPVTFPLADLPVGGVKHITYGGIPAVVIRSAESIKAFSLICTHLGCIVEWQSGNQEFYCPCHDGRFDQFGEVIAGPPPVPLEQFPVRVEDDQVVVGELV